MRVQEILKNLFLKKITIFKWQFNLFAFVCVSIGIVLGSYFGVTRIFKALALNDTVKTWTTNLANVANYTYDSDLITFNSGNVTPGVNKLTNSSFDTDMAGWSGLQSYILQDEFSDTLPLEVGSDTFTRTDGSIGTAETGGAWTGSTWSISGNKAVNNPTLESDLMPSLYSTYDTGTGGWQRYGTNLLENDNGSVKFTYVDQSQGGYHYLIASSGLLSEPVDGRWYSLRFDGKVGSGSVDFKLYNGIAYNTASINSTSFVTSNFTMRKLVGNASVRFFLNLGDFGAGETAFWDNVYFKPITTSSLFSTVNYSSSPEVTVQADVTVNVNSQAGVVMNLDSASNPQNFVIAYHNGSSIRMEKSVGGVYTTLINTASTYVAGATVKVVKNSTAYSLFYNGTQVGTTQTISDAGIISNTRHGLFSTYSGNSLDNFKLYNSINNTNATDGSNVRVTLDTLGKLSISGGKLNFASGGPQYGADPGIWYPAVTRVPGRLLTSKYNISGGVSRFGWSNASKQNSSLSVFNFNGGTLYNLGKIVGSYNLNTDYYLLSVLRASGQYLFIKGGNFTNWTLLDIGPAETTSPLYPHSSSYSNVVATLDNLRIPSTTWLPTPLAYDTFTRADGATGNSETTGPDSQTTPSLSWTGGTVSGNKLVISPTLGSNLVANANLEDWASATDATSWTEYVSGSTTANRESTDVHGGSYAARLDVDSANSSSSFSQYFTSTVGTWYEVGGYAKTNVAGRTVQFPFQSGAGAVKTLSTSYTPYFAVTRAIGTSTNLYFGRSSSISSSLYLDDAYAKPLTTSSLFSSISTSDSDVVIDTSVTLTVGTQAGIVLNLDSTTNPQNFVIVYHDGVYVRIEKCVNGVYTAIQENSATYADGRVLRVIKEGTTYRVYYNNALVGTDKTISDASIINNTKHGLFSTYSNNSLDNFSIYARGTGGEYNDIPGEGLTATHETGTKYSGSGSTKLVAGGNDADYTQSVNVGDTGTYHIEGYAYTSGSAVTSADVNLVYNETVVTTSFVETGTAGWYRLSGTFTGIASAKEAGIRVKMGKTVYVDDIKVFKDGTYSIYNTTAYSNILTTTYDSFESTLTVPGNSSVKFQICENDGSACESGNTWKYYNGSTWTTATNTTTHVNTAAELTQSVMQQFPSVTKKISFKAIMTIDGDNIPTLSSIQIGLTTDTTPPTNATNPLLIRTADVDCSDADNCWTNQTHPKFEWTDGSDAESGIKGYCLYLGTDIDGNPAESKGKLGTSPVPTTDTPCNFIVSSPALDLESNPAQLGTALSNDDNFTTTQDTYFLKIKAIDIAGNPSTDPVMVRFQYDGIRPTNVSYISTTAGNFSNVVDMSFSWPTSGTGISVDNQSNILGWQYQINSTEGTWKGTTHSDLLNIDYIPVGDNLYQLTELRDGSSIVSGNNVVYFRTVDQTGNFSSDATVRTGNLSFGGEAPEFGGTDVVTVTPNTNTTNSYALSWPASTATVGQNVTHYYYSVNTPPASTLATLQSNVSTYIDTGTTRSIPVAALPNVNKGSNTVYVVSVDDASTPNYSPSNYITGTFTLNSTNPDNVGNLVVSDLSIKSQSKWNAALTWTAPVYQGAGNLTYQVYRSADGTSFTQVGTSSGLSYVDSTPESSLYFYKVYTKDGADALSSGTNAVSIIPTGKWTEPPTLESEPMVTSITTKKAVVTWGTNRTSDSKVAFGTKSGVYNTEEPSNADQVSNHTITLSGLNPNTTYYYISKWTDEDGNTGVSEEKIFKTQPAPVVRNASTTNIGLSSAIVKFTSKGASKVKIYYGETTSFGGVKEMQTSPIETTYTVQLTGLDDGTKYYYKINKYDSENTEYEGDTYTFTTLPQPKISNVVLQEVIGTSQTTILVTWNTNTPVSSIITYYPEGKTDQAKDEVVVNLISGEHKMILRGLFAETQYILQVKGRDKIGNEALSDTHKFTTSTDSRPPQISGVTIEGSTVPSVATTAQETTAQLIVSWTTDEPATSQVEYGEGSGIEYPQKTQLDSNLTYNHLVIISGLTPSKVYHLRVISSDKANNSGKSIDTVTIAPKSTDNALDLVILNLQQIFGIFGK